MKQIVYILFFIIFFSSCQNVERSEKPADLIREDKMVEVLTEVSLLNSARNFNKRLFEETGLTPEEYIYEKFDIDSLQLERSNNYYAENYNRYEKIYSEVKENLEKMKVKLDSIRDEEIRVRDSITAAERERDSIQGDTLEKDSLKIDSLKIDSLQVDQIPLIDSLANPAINERQ